MIPSTDAVLARMDDRLRELSEQRDGRRRFLRMYGIFQRAIGSSISGGAFLDPSFAEEMCGRMAEYYFEADRLYDEDPEACPEPWRYCIERARSGRTNLLQDMLLGMNAHINYDLPLAAHDTLVQRGDLDRPDDASAPSRELQLAFDANLRRRYFDFLQINHCAWQTIPAIQDAMCAEFSPLLGLVNRASFRYSGRIVERLICDHRDRAWSHTLLLATAADREELESLASFISSFTMARAALIDRLTLNPIRLASAIRRRGDEAPAVLRRRHVRLLVDHLDRPLTAKAARRALAEYGPQIHPVLAEVLAEGAADGQVAEEILLVLAQAPSPLAAETLLRRWSDGAHEDDGATIRLLASMRLAGVRLSVPQARLLEAFQDDALQARSLSESARVLAGEDVLLSEALSSRLARVLRAMLEIVTILHPNRALVASARRHDPRAELWGPESLTEVMDALPRSVRRSVVPLLESARVVRRSSTTECLEALANASDPWLQACALRDIGERRLTEHAPLVESLASSQSEVVRDTALRARRQLEQSIDEDVETPVLSIIEKVLYLKNVELFQEIPAEDLAEVARVAEERRFERGEELITEGVPGEQLYVIIDGEVDVIAGGDRHLARLGESSVIGEMAILSDAPTSAACIAATEGRALRIRRTSFLRFLLDYPEIAIGLIHVLSVRLRETSAQVPSDR